MRIGSATSRAVAILFALLLAFLTPALAFAHAYPVQSQPSPNATVGQSPDAVRIFFSNSLEPRLSGGEVYDAQRQPASAGPAVVDPTNPRQLTIPLRPGLPNGTYTVVWHVVSADDGHSTAGVFAFGVGEAAQAPVISAQQLGAASGQEATPVGLVGRFLVYLAAALILGTGSFVLLVARSDPKSARLVRLVGLAAVLLLVGQMLRLIDESALAQAATLPGATPARGIGQLLFGSRFGRLWLGRLGLGVAGLLLAIFGGRVAGRLTWPWLGWVAIGLALVVDLAESGHAASGNLLAYTGLIQATLTWGTASSLYLPAAYALLRIAKPLSLLVDGLHLTAMGVWIGGLLALGVGGEGRAYLVRRFSRVATVGMIVVLLTGLYNTWLYLAGPASYIDSGYGRSLLLKHLAILALLATAGVNHFVTVPLLSEGRVAGYFPAGLVDLLTGRPLLGIRIESGLALVVLLSTGVLTSLGPARQPQEVLLDPSRELRLAAEPFAAIVPLSGGGDAHLVVDSGRVGPNSYTVTLLDPARASAVQRAYLELSPLELGAGGPNAATTVIQLALGRNGSFVGRGLEPSASGLWRAEVRIYFVDGTIGSGDATFQSTTRWAAVADLRAIQLLSEAATAMTRVRSARIVEVLGNGAGGIVVDDYAFVAPDRQEVVNPGGDAEIEIGPTVYVRRPGSPTWRAEPSGGFQWPDEIYDYLQNGVGGIVVGQRSLLGVDCTVVAFYSPSISGIYEEWIGNDDHLIHQEVMSAPAHDMVNLYYAFDQSIQITPPAQS